MSLLALREDVAPGEGSVRSALALLVLRMLPPLRMSELVDTYPRSAVSSPVATVYSNVSVLEPLPLV